MADPMSNSADTGPGANSLRISPLSPLMVPGRYGRVPEDASSSAPVVLSHRLPVSLVQVQSFPDSVDAVRAVLSEQLGDMLALEPAVSASDTLAIMPTGPGRYLLESTHEGLEDQMRGALDPADAAVTGLTHGRCVISISGDMTTFVLASGIALDFSTVGFPVSEVKMSSHHEIGLTVHRLGEQHFELYAFTSLVGGLWHWLSHAAAEVGYEIVES